MTHAQTLDLDPKWEYVADTVMGGVSKGQAVHGVIQSQDATRLIGTVSLDNNGGFVQIAFDLAEGEVFDASAFTGIALDVYGNGETYDLRLRTDALTQPWQSFRTDFTAPAEWTMIKVPFAAFSAHRTDATFNAARLRRVGILAIGREMQADIAVSGVRLYR
ncbi:CIA30 family protein [uncultured Tateyamaria sp.]|uniref:CIA30 family protein n=1 Tax=uncultured Tateyamaria sp. TaxID=455651 RepID=UPI00262BEFF7|nr:CIA30 family protein [uncultured Tateyamaria sp.]